jgi:hypothetical protein
MSQVNEVGAKLKSALDAVEEAKRALAELEIDGLRALSGSDYDDFEDIFMRMFLASMVRRLADSELRRPIELMRSSTDRALWLLREVENHVGGKKEGSQSGGGYLRTRSGILARTDP